MEEKEKREGAEFGYCGGHGGGDVRGGEGVAIVAVVVILGGGGDVKEGRELKAEGSWLLYVFDPPSPWYSK